MSKLIGVVDYPTVWRRRPLPGLAFIGEAAVTADYVWGVGCGWAFQSGKWLVEATADCFGSEEALNAGVRLYRRRLHRRRLHKELMGHFLLICHYQTGRGFNPIESLMFGAAAKALITAELVRDFGYRRISVRQVLAPSAFARAFLECRRGAN